MAFAVPIMKNNFNIYLVDEKPMRTRNLSTCSSGSSTSSSSSFRGSQNSLNSVNSMKSSRSAYSNEVLYKSRWDLTNPLARLGKLEG